MRERTNERSARERRYYGTSSRSDRAQGIHGAKEGAPSSPTSSSSKSFCLCGSEKESKTRRSRKMHDSGAPVARIESALEKKKVISGLMLCCCRWVCVCLGKNAGVVLMEMRCKRDSSPVAGAFS